ncbi:MAG: GHKL domain-containing protein, partial [Desulfobacterales bacterium]|nr:GHKL domain-containing protein [Desulfobacterales bacterium]
EMVHPDDQEKISQIQHFLLSDTLSMIIEMDLRLLIDSQDKRSQKILWIYCQLNKIKYQKEIVNLLNIIDITESKLLENRLILQDKMASLGRVAASIAHEIRNPLSGISLTLDHIKKNCHQPEQAELVKESIANIETDISKINSIIKLVLDFSRPFHLQLGKYDINLCITKAVQLSLTLLRKSDIQLNIEISEEPIVAFIDPQLIEQVILNLITNAAEALYNTQGQKSISISSLSKKEIAEIRICDSGPGIPDNLKDKIFEPFFTTKSSGVGIGLSLCQRIVFDHHGMINVSRSDLGGAEFSIHIPLEKKDESYIVSLFRSFINYF